MISAENSVSLLRRWRGCRGGTFLSSATATVARRAAENFILRLVWFLKLLSRFWCWFFRIWAFYRIFSSPEAFSKRSIDADGKIFTQLSSALILLDDFWPLEIPITRIRTFPKGITQITFELRTLMYAIILSTKDDDWKCIDKKCHGHCEFESDSPIRLSRKNVFKISKITKRAKSQKTFCSSSPV